MKPHLIRLREIVARLEVASAAEISRHYGAKPEPTTQRLRDLRDMGHVVCVRKGVRAYWCSPENVALAEQRVEASKRATVEARRVRDQERHIARVAALDTTDLDKVVQRVVAASQAQPVETTAVRSVFDLGRNE